MASGRHVRIELPRPRLHCRRLVEPAQRAQALRKRQPKPVLGEIAAVSSIEIHGRTPRSTDPGANWAKR